MTAADFRKFPLLLVAAFYRVAYLLHHQLFLRKGKPLKNSRLLVVGSYRIGGAGKTPFCIWLVKQLAAKGYRTALLSHSYAYDEVKMLRQIFEGQRHVQIFDTKNRYQLAHELDKQKTFDFILCDDGFEDSRLAGAVTLQLSWENPPTKIRDLWPMGFARSLSQDHRQSKTIPIHCNNSHHNRGIPQDASSLFIHFFINKIISITGQKFQDAPKVPANLICGIGDPKRFCRDLETFGIDISQKIYLKDHDKRFASKLKRALRLSPNSPFIVSQKDAMRLPPSFVQEFGDRIFIAYQEIDTTQTNCQGILKEILKDFS